MALRETDSTSMSAPASEAFRVHFNDLVVGIQDPDIVACALYPLNIISSGVMEEVGMIALTPVQKKMKLLSAVGDKLKLEPGKFEDLVTVLKNNSPSLRDVAQRLEDTYATFVSQPTSLQVVQKASPGQAMTEIALRKTRSRFSNLVVKVRSSMEARSDVKVKDVREFLVNFFEGECNIPEVNDLCKIFESVTIAKLWRYDHYGPLEEVAESFLPEEDPARVLVTEYVSQLSAFNATTKIIDFIKISQLEDREEDNQLFSPKKYNRYYRKLTVKLKLRRNVSELTLDYVHEIWKTLKKEFDLPSLTAVIDEILEGSLCITWLVLPHIVKKIKATFFKSLQFLKHHHIISIVLYGDLLTLYDEEWMEGSTPLYRASFTGDSEAVETLLEGGANTNQQNDNADGETPLIGACQNGLVHIARMLISHGAKVDSLSKVGESVLIIASGYGHCEVVVVLLEYGATVNLQANKGFNALISACNYGNTDIARMLLDHGAVIDHRQKKDGLSALMMASGRGHTETVKMLLERGATVDLPDETGRTALIGACIYGNTDIARMLLDHGAVIDHCEKEGFSALMAASGGGHTETVKVLLERGATVDLPSVNGATALFAASGYGHPSTARVLLQHGAFVDYKLNDGTTALWVASSEGHHETVMLLIEFGAVIDLPTDDEDGETALIVACQKGHAETARVLLDKGAFIDYQDKKGRSSLVVACVGGRVETVKVLLEHKAQLDLQNQDGWTALFFAAKQGQLEVVNMLLDHGAAVHIRSNSGLTAFDVAKSEAQQAVCQLLTEYSNQKVKVVTQESEPQQPEIKTEPTEEQREELKSVGKQIRDLFERLFLRDLVKKRERTSQHGGGQGTTPNIMDQPKESRSFLNRLLPRLGRRRRQLVGTAPAPEH